MSKGRILITTGIYPPKIGGPAQYAKNLREVWGKKGYLVKVKTFHLENYLPTGIRHLFFFFKIIPAVSTSDFILALDTFSVGFPTVLAGKIFGKIVVIRTGGDFLWEGYIERTGKKVLFRNFYIQEKDNLNLKEKLIFKLTRLTLNNASKVVFSTTWQRDIFVSAYALDTKKTGIIENYYGTKEGDFEFNSKTFIASTRNLKWKNLDILKNVFYKKDSIIPKDINLLTTTSEFESFMEKVKNSYAVILVSLGDISPNLILDAIRLNKPFICTKEVGIFDRIKDIGIFVNPLDEKEIEGAVLKLLDALEYKKWQDKVRSFNFVHTWDEMADEYIRLKTSTK
ncbi:MAG: hypothetical protein AAB719_02740 [Patescibacteria group bacterium]